MATLSAEYINPFLSAATSVLKDVCQLEAKLGQLSLKDIKYDEDTLVIIIGVTGEMKGSVMISFDSKTACDIASKMMMGMPVDELNDMARSAISELGNMILGNAATVFAGKGIVIDITPPSLCFGNMSISTNYAKNICVPLLYDEGKTIEVNVSMKDN
jgi:chemotaxis protein CheX